MSSDSNNTVPSLAMAPAKLRKNVKKAIYPVLLLQKFVYNYGNFDPIYMTELLFDTIYQ